MYKGINFWAFEAGITTADAFRLARDAGYDGVELTLAQADGPVSLTTSKEECALIAKQAADAGIKLYSLATGLYWTYSLTDPDAEKREKAKNIVRRQLQLASWLGCGTILVVPGAVSVSFAPDLGVVPYETAYDRSLEALRELAPEAERLGVVLGVENVWNNFLLSPLEMRDFLDKIGSSFVKSFFDVGNVVKFGYPEHWIAALGSRVGIIHFKDFRREADNLAGFVDLLEGDVNYPAVMDALRAIGYDGWVTAEMLPPYTHYPRTLIYNTSRAMDAILGR
ncbi:MAG: sugar phosphate isomerase/epimerase family protein [Clostridiaceae bacterium]|nr:sugar phosphate isomerase/epimerase family protein [Clostridiaceae bacterium]